MRHRELRFNSRDREGVTFGGDLCFDCIPRDDPATDFCVVTEFEMHLSPCLICDDIDLVHDIECVQAYVITDQAGREVRLELSDDTIIRSRVIPGDTIEAEISSEDHTLSVTRIEP